MSSSPVSLSAMSQSSSFGCDSSVASTSATNSKRPRCGRIVCKNTFIDVADDDTESEFSPRASSDPGSTYGGNSRDSFGFEQSYVEQNLQHLWIGSSDGTSTGINRDIIALPSCHGITTVMPLAEVAERLSLDQLVPPQTEKFNKQQLYAQIHAKARKLDEFSRKESLTNALSTIEEIPEQVEAALYANAEAFQTQVQNDVDQVRNLIADVQTADKLHEKSNLIEQIDAVPKLLSLSLEAGLLHASASIKRCVDGVVQELAETSDSERIISQMRQIPAEIKEIAGRAIDEATQKLKAETRQQIDAAVMQFNGVAESTAEVMTQIMSIMPEELPATLTGVERVAGNSVEQAISTVRVGIAAGDQHIANQAVADTLLRGKVGHDHCESEPPKSCDSQGLTEIQNPGSFGHPEFCRRPCLFYINGSCKNGNSCVFCHVPHPKRATHLDKRGRETVKQMTREEREALISPILAQKLRSKCLGPRMEQLLRRLIPGGVCLSEEQRLLALGSIGLAQKRKLESSLHNMSARALLILLHRPESNKSDSIDGLEEFLHELRSAETFW